MKISRQALDYYLTYDHRARSRTTLLATIGGVTAWVVAQASGASSKVSIVSCLAITAAVEFGRAFSYRRSFAGTVGEQLASTVYPKRRLLLQYAASSVALVLFGMLRKLIEPQEVAAQSLLIMAKKAATVGDQREANDLLRQASEIIKKAAEQRSPALPEFFFTAVNILNQLSGKGVDQSTVHGTLIQIAEYRSALTPPPNMRLITFKPLDHAILIHNGSSVQGGAFDFRAVTGIAAVAPDPITSPADLPMFDGTLFWGGTQTLDKIRWHNVTFVNTHIVYGGGPTELRNVRFISCTFKAVPSDRGRQVLSYAALDKKRLELQSAV